MKTIIRAAYVVIQKVEVGRSSVVFLEKGDGSSGLGDVPECGEPLSVSIFSTTRLDWDAGNGIWKWMRKGSNFVLKNYNYLWLKNTKIT